MFIGNIYFALEKYLVILEFYQVYNNIYIFENVEKIHEKIFT